MARGRKKKNVQKVVEQQNENLELIMNSENNNVYCAEELEQKKECIVKEIYKPEVKKEKIDRNLQYNKSIRNNSNITRKPLHTRWKNCHVAGKINDLSFKFQIGNS